MLEAIKQATVAVEYATEAFLRLDNAASAPVDDLAHACAAFLSAYTKLAPNAKAVLSGSVRPIE